MTPAEVLASETRHLRGAARRTGKGSHVVVTSQRCEFCHNRPAAGFSVNGRVYKRACKRCLDAVYGADDR